MAEVINAPTESLERSGGGGNRDRKDDPPSSPPPPLQPSRRRERDSRERRDDRDGDRPPARRGNGGDFFERNKSSPPPQPRERDRDYKRRSSVSPPPAMFRDRRHSPTLRRSPPYKRSRRDDGGGYDGRRGSPRGGFGLPDRRYGHDFAGGHERDLAGRLTFPDDRRFIGRGPGFNDWDPSRDSSNSSMQREGLMSYKQFIQELEDDILPAEAERRYQEYRSEYISTQKRVFFESHKEEEWLKEKYHPTKLPAVIERRNDLARKSAKNFLLDLIGGTLDLGPGSTPETQNKQGLSNSPKSEDEVDVSGKRRRNARGSVKETDLPAAAPRAHPVSSESRRIQIDVELAQALVRKLDSEKGIEENILAGSENDKSLRDKSHGSSTGPIVIVRGITSVKGLEGVELLDTLVTYLWRIHGVDYYGMIEITEPKGFRHLRCETKSSDATDGASEWEKKLDLRWQERLRSQDPLEVMTAKEKIDATAVESLDPYVRKIRDEKYGWKYGCGAKGCTKLFHAAEYVHKHLKLKHAELVMEVTSKFREELYFQNYMNDPDAPGGTPVMQQQIGKDKQQRRKPGLEGRLKDDRGNRRERDKRGNGMDRFDRSDNAQSGEFMANNDGPDGDGRDDNMFDAFGAQSLHGHPFPSDIPPPVLMPVPGAGPLGPFVPAPPEVAMRMFREQGGPPPFESGGRSGRPVPPLSGPAPILLTPDFRQDPRRIRSYQDLDAPEDEVTVIDYRSL